MKNERPPTLGAATLRKAVSSDDGLCVQAGAEVVVLERVGDEYIIEVLVDEARDVAEVSGDVLEWLCFGCERPTRFGPCEVCDRATCQDCGPCMPEGPGCIRSRLGVSE